MRLPAPSSVYSAEDQAQTRRAIETESDKTLKRGHPFDFVPVLPSYAKAGLPAVGKAGGIIFVTDDTGGSVPAFSDGTNWRRVTDRNIIS